MIPLFTLQVCKDALGDKIVVDRDTKFMRKGKSGDWKTKFDAETVAKFQAWEEKALAGSDLKFCYEVKE